MLLQKAFLLAGTILISVFLVSVPAYAEQAKYSSILDVEGNPVGGAVYERYYAPPLEWLLLDGSPPANAFSADDITNYPFEIYLPNESAPQNYRIHSQYTNDTDACASCHATHTAVGPSLLQWFNIYDTCMACHDGTVSTTYNVVKGTIKVQQEQAQYTTFEEYMAFIEEYNATQPPEWQVTEPETKHDHFEYYVDQLVKSDGTYFPAEDPNDTMDENLYWAANDWYNNQWDGSPKLGGITYKPLSGGMFGFGHEESLSRHTVSGAVTIAAAPGGSSIPELADPGNPRTVRWDAIFGCESCHNPHGSGGNARLLNPDPNWSATKNNRFEGVLATRVGQVPNPKISGGVAYAVYPGATAFTEGSTTEVLTNYGGIQGNTVVREREPYSWLTGYPYEYKIYVNGELQEEGIDYLLNSRMGHTYIEFYSDPGPNAEVKAYFTASLRVKMDIDNYLTGSETVRYISGINEFCGACHTDYNTAVDKLYRTEGKNAGQYVGSGHELTGLYSEAYRHQVGMQTEILPEGLKFEGENTVFCLTCHLAHGTSQNYWVMTLGSNSQLSEKWDDSLLVELSGSSALKRMPNMGTCEACHQKGAQNAGYNRNSGQAVLGSGGSIQDGVFTQDTAAYVGMKKCIGCHREHAKGFNKTKHASTLTDQVPTVIEEAYGGAVDYLLAGRYLLQDDGSKIEVVGMWDAGTQTVVASDLSITDFERDCMRCHVSGRNAQYEIEQVTDLGVTCEACHGPGSNHIKNPSGENITNPANIGVIYSAQVCGQCHTSNPDDPYGYQPGDNLDDYVSTPYGTLLNPDGVSQSRTDGQKLPKSGEYEEFDNSDHGRTGNLMSCASCHSSHGLNSEGRQFKGAAVQTCLVCHQEMKNLDVIMPNGTHAFRTSYPNTSFE
ncbi:cytochrome c3 family protein [Calderihabitans maritimus]|uniref:Doubled CXXCH domain-containing protein n=1 Tax=Calderihabitans maritimus TaxID=1246530 RepID=A0A1Z5HVM3_9FIRM|nr:cytochrome c3 family protein [Calderihabitans maritimus]GAW93586.1 doubled CXXCH domain-containing protein [Calderihabitans maritimus]